MSNNVTKRIPDIRIASFLQVAIIGHLIFGLPVISGILLLHLTDVKALFFIFIPIILISIPISAAFAWLIAKGSNWTNTQVAITALCSFPGRVYSIVFGGLLGFHLFSTVGGVITAILFYLLAFALTIPFGKFLSRKVFSATVSIEDQ